MIWSLILGLFKGPLGRILDTIDKKVDATTERLLVEATTACFNRSRPCIASLILGPTLRQDLARLRYSPHDAEPTSLCVYGYPKPADRYFGRFGHLSLQTPKFQASRRLSNRGYSADDEDEGEDLKAVHGPSSDRTASPRHFSGRPPTNPALSLRRHRYRNDGYPVDPLIEVAAKKRSSGGCGAEFASWALRGFTSQSAAKTRRVELCSRRLQKKPRGVAGGAKLFDGKVASEKGRPGAICLINASRCGLFRVLPSPGPMDHNPGETNSLSDPERNFCFQSCMEKSGLGFFSSDHASRRAGASLHGH